MFCQRGEICFKTSWGLGICGKGWVRPCSGKMVPCPSPTVSVTNGTIEAAPQCCLTQPPKWPSNWKTHLVGRVFKKTNHDASMLLFNSTFILELYTTGTLKAVVMSVFLHHSPFCLLTFFSQKIMPNGFKHFLHFLCSVAYVCAVVFHVVLNLLTKFLIFYNSLVNFVIFYLLKTSGWYFYFAPTQTKEP